MISLRIDSRSLALFRVSAAALLIADAVRVWPDLEPFYTQGGLLPLHSGLPDPSGALRLSLLDTVSSLAAVRAFVAAGLLAALAWLAGWLSRWAHAACAVYFVSLMNRNGLIRHAGDWLLANMLVLSWPLDTAGRLGADKADNRASPIASAALLLQLPAVYLLSAWAKRGPDWLDGSALHYALSFTQLSGTLGRALASAPIPVLKLLTWGTMALEWLAPAALVLAGSRDIARRVTLGALVLLHVAIALCLPVLWDIQAVMLAGLALWLAPADWDALGRLAPKTAAAARAVEARLQALPGATRGAAAPGVARAGEAFAAAVALAFVVNAYNRDLAAPLGLLRLPAGWLSPVYSRLYLGHSWGFFGPEVMRADGWWLAEAETGSGERLDLWTRLPLRFERPSDMPRFGRYWRFALYRTSMSRYAAFQPRIAAWLLHRAAREGLAVRELKLSYMLDPTAPPGSRRGEPRRVVFWEGRPGSVPGHLGRVSPE